MTVVGHTVLVGLMGTGKTTVGRLLADATRRPLLDCDELLTARVGRSASDVARADGIDALHALEAEVLFDALAAASPSVITAAASTIEDERCRAALGRAEVVWLRAPVDVLVGRARSQDHRPLHDDAEAQLAAQAARRDPLFAALADMIFDVASLSPEEVVAALVPS